MRVAIYIEDGLTQLALTPETDWEKTAVKAIADNPGKLQLHKGSFYACMGGWVRQSANDDSLMLSVKNA